MKVALVCPYAWDRPGGVQSHIRDLASRLIERGHVVVVVAPWVRDRFEGTSELVPAGRAIPVPTNGSVAPIAFGPGAWKGVKHALLRFRPDVIHVHEPFAPSTSLAGILSADAPVVGTFHASADRSLGYRIGRPVLSKVMQKLDARIAVSEAARHLAHKYFPADYTIIPNGFDARRFASVEPADLEVEDPVVFVGRLEPRKGLDLLLQGVAGSETPVVVVGEGPEEGRARTIARRLGVNAHFLGRIQDEELPSVLSAAKVFCSPARGGESFGIVLLEAMASGAPVLCSDIPGFRYAAGDAAELFTPGDAQDLGVKLRELLGSEARRARLVERGRKRAALFDWGALVPAVEAVYERVRRG